MTVRLSFVTAWVQNSSGRHPFNLSAIFTYQYQLGYQKGKLGLLRQSDCLYSRCKNPVYEVIRSKWPFF